MKGKPIDTAAFLPPAEEQDLARATEEFRKGAKPAFPAAPAAPKRAAKNRAGTERISPVLPTTLVARIDAYCAKTGGNFSRGSLIRIGMSRLMDELEQAEKEGGDATRKLLGL